MNTGIHNICIVSVHRSFYSETFIRSHIEQLPAKVHHLYGGYIPLYNSEGNLFVNSFFCRIFPSLIFHFSRKQNLDAIERYLVDNKIEAVLCEYGPSGVEMMELCKKLDMPLFVYFHGYDAYRKNELKKYKSQYQRLFKIARKLFVVSKDMQTKLIEMGASADKLVYNPCGADTNLFLPSNPPENAKIFFAAGRFEETKCPQNTIKAFALVVEKYPDAKLIMAGTGSLFKKCKHLVDELKINEKVDLVGVLSHEEIVTQMKKSRAFVQHSVTTQNGDMEGTPVAIMEAGACGLPVIATKHGGISDVVIDGVTGILVAENDITAMAAGMIKMLTEPEIAAHMGKAASERIRTDFSQTKSIKKLWDEIESQL